MAGRTLVLCIVACLIRSGKTHPASTGSVDSHHVLDLSIRSRVTCGFPGIPSYGNVTIRGGGHAVGVVARFSCALGYKLKGAAASKCVPPGRWSHALPWCQRLTCGSPPQPSHGHIFGKIYVDRTLVSYRIICNGGYTLIGDKQRSCGTNGQWIGKAPSCVDVNCGAPKAFANGWVATREGTTYLKKAEYGCNRNYYPLHNLQSVCQFNGLWRNVLYRCLPITCPKLTAPANARIEYKRSVNVVGSKVVYTCNHGYHQAGGNRERVCTTASGALRGTWSGSNPSCVAYKCGDPGKPRNGNRDGSIFKFGYVVTFMCWSGYVLRGNHRLECKVNGWTGQRPDCLACPLNEYKSGANRLSTCTKCPANSQTTFPAATDLRACVCKSGFRGPPGGPCKQIFCPRLEKVPPHADVRKYGANEVGARYLYRCAPGYILDKGNSERTCTKEGKWSGIEPVCIACPKDSYKKSDNACLPCPRHTHTAGPGNALGGCVCDKGYTGSNGKPCTDIDECKINNGGCDQVCSNTQGSFKCACNIPGYVVEPENPKKCKAAKRCGVPDLPPNGGLVCVADDKSNQVQCTVRCNAGYEFPSSTNNYDGCGANTGFKWMGSSSSFVCIREFFPGFKMFAAHAYFPSRCNQLTSGQQIKVKTEFIDILKKAGVCRNYNAHCNVGTTLILCGPTTA